MDGHYFDSYGDFGIHRTMLQDRVRAFAAPFRLLQALAWYLWINWPVRIDLSFWSNGTWCLEGIGLGAVSCKRWWYMQQAAG